ncbi:MAG: amino acid ABC transporter ATP-binding protein [Ruminococcaceae bacterium]|nr:amino acid ABC transporter ATP-binding protein [Oscillospiraceae bacterium]
MPILEVKGFKKSFGKTEVLKGVDFTLEKGKVLVIIGSSGSGKTTLLRCLTFLETPDEGAMFVGGEELLRAPMTKGMKDEEIREKRSHFGLVFQNFNLFPQYTVLENLCLAPKLKAKEQPDYKKDKVRIDAEIEARAKELLMQVGLSDKADSYPCQLSGGQQQRVAIARALALSPDILCFDEPTSALDPELTGEVLRVLRELAEKNTTMIIVTHEMAFAREIADHIIFMDEGVVAAQGSPAELFGEQTQNEHLNRFIRAMEQK